MHATRTDCAPLDITIIAAQRVVACSVTGLNSPVAAVLKILVAQLAAAPASATHLVASDVLSPRNGCNNPVVTQQHIVCLCNQNDAY